jgi:hypothetical protein
MARSILLTLPMFLAACSDTSVKAFNAEPVAEITSHSDGDEVVEGDTETFRGSVSDPDHAASDLTATWYLDDDILCESAAPDDDGITTCESQMPATTSQIILVVQDPENAAGSDQVSLDLVINESPDGEIITPTIDGIYYSDQLITFSGIAGDTEDAAVDLIASWESSLDGAIDVDAELDEGGEFTGFGYLSEGEHAIELTITDTTGKILTDSVIIDVGPPNSAPSCEISAPESGSSTAEGELVNFEASVSDVDVASDWLEVSWESDKDGALGDSTPSSAGEVLFSTSGLSVETHTVTMTVTDEVGATCTDLVQVTVGTAPAITLDSPADGDVVNEGEMVSFQATVSDGEDLASDLSLSWSSSADGEFSTQSADSTGLAVFSTDALSTDTHAITVTVTDTDGLTATATTTLTVNGIPTEASVSLSPDPATSADSLVATASGSTDPEGTSISYSYEWAVDGVTSTASTSSSLSSSYTNKYETWSVTVTPSDGIAEGPSATASLSISNAAPEVTDVTISPDPALTGETLTCSYTFSDADGDADASTIEWGDGTSVYGTDATLSGSFSGGNELTCTVTPSDGEDTGTPALASITISNSAPEITEVSLSPTDLYTEGTVEATVSTSDADDDVVDLSYEWYVDGALISSATGSSLYGGSYFDKDEEVYVVVTPNDGTDDGDAVSSDGIIVLNSPPDAPEISIDPEEPSEGEDDLVCYIDVDSVDDDGDAITYEFAWELDGSSYTSTNTTVEDGDTILAGEIYTGEQWSCSVTPHDGTEYGESASTSVLIDEDLALPDDADGDGFSSEMDCDDEDASIYPGAGDTYGDGIDSDCDGLDCNAGFSGSAYFAACYDTQTWSDAETLCQDAGYDGLVTILDSTENSDITDLLYVEGSASDKDIYWIGFSDTASEGTWVWSSGLSVSFTNWNSGEPSGGTEDCGHIYSSLWSHVLGLWNDHPCSNQQSYVCEFR